MAEHLPEWAMKSVYEMPDGCVTENAANCAQAWADVARQRQEEIERLIIHLEGPDTSAALRADLARVTKERDRLRLSLDYIANCPPASFGADGKSRGWYERLIPLHTADRRTRNGEGGVMDRPEGHAEMNAGPPLMASDQLRADLARVTAERDKAIAEVGKIGRELGKTQAENDRLFHALDEIATQTTFNADVAISMMQIARAALKQGD